MASVGSAPEMSRQVLRLAPEAAARLGGVGTWRLDLPINRWAGNDGYLTARLGPDEWLLLAPAATPVPTASLQAALGGAFHALVDVSARDCGLIVEGPGAEAVINSGCPLDLDAAAFPVGAASRTVLARAEIVLIRLGPSVFCVEARRSFADYVTRLLQLAAAQL